MIPDLLAVQAAANGARSELASSGMLASGDGYPRLVIDVLRVDELSRGIRVQGGQPHAGAMSVAVTLRARIFAAGEREANSDSGDVRRAVQLAGDDDPRVDGAAHDSALRSAAERAGRAAARIALGIPEPADETP